ncbi:hypothetical protein DMENIID0001_048750 [Sergentomyia squamirostris]
MYIQKITVCGLPGFPERATYELSPGINILHGTNRGKLIEFIQALQFLLNPLYENVSTIPGVDPNAYRQGFVEIDVKCVNGKFFTLRREMLHLDQAFINNDVLRIDNYFNSLQEIILPNPMQVWNFQLIHLLTYTETDWWNWMKRGLDLVECMDKEFGHILDRNETLKRQYAEKLKYAQDKILHLKKCFEIDRNIKALGMVKQQKEAEVLEAQIQDCMKDLKILAIRGRRLETQIYSLFLRQHELENAIVTHQLLSSIASFHQSMCEFHSLNGWNEFVDNDEKIVELKTFLVDLKELGNDVTLNVQQDEVLPKEHTAQYQREFFELCLTFCRIKDFLLVGNNLADHEQQIRNLQDLRNEVTTRFKSKQEEISLIWNDLKKNLERLEEVNTEFQNDQNESRALNEHIGEELNSYYTMDLQMLTIISNEDQYSEEMSNLMKILDIDPAVLKGLLFIEEAIAELISNEALPFPKENYHGPLFLYLSFTENTPMTLLQKFMPLLKSLYTLILVETTDDANKLLEIARPMLDEGEIQLDILPLKGFHIPDKEFTKIPGFVSVGENLQDSLYRDHLKRILERIVYAEQSDPGLNLTVVNAEGDFVMEHGPIGGGCYVTQLNDISEYLKKYTECNEKFQKLKIEKSSLKMKIRECEQNLEVDRMKLKSFHYDMELIKLIQGQMDDLCRALKDFHGVRKLLHSATVRFRILETVLEHLTGDQLESLQFYETKLEELSIEKEEDPDLKKIISFISCLNDRSDQLKVLSEVIDWKYNWYGCDPIFQYHLTNPEITSEEHSERVEVLIDDLELITETFQAKSLDFKANEQKKTMLKIKLETFTKISNKKKAAQNPQLTEPFYHLSLDKVSERLSNELNAFKDLTGLDYMPTIKDQLNIQIKFWSSQMRTLGKKSNNTCGSSLNEAIILNENSFSLMQIRSFLGALTDTKIFQLEDTSKYYSFYLKIQTGNWIDGDRITAQNFLSLANISGVKWVIKENEDVKYYENFTDKDKMLLILTVNYIMSTLNHVSTFLIDLEGVENCFDHYDQNDITNLLYNMINHHQAIVLSPEAITDDMFHNISME